MAARRILILYQDSILAQGLLSLLRERASLQVRSGQLQDPHTKELLREFVPDAVIIDREDFARQAAITIDQLLRVRPDLKVIDISARNDIALVFESQQVRLAQIDDLLAAVA